MGGAISNGYWFDASISIYHIDTLVELGAAEWRNDGGQPLVTSQLIRHNSLPVGNQSYDRWKAVSGLDSNNRRLADRDTKAGTIPEVISNHTLSASTIQNSNWAYSKTTLYMANLGDGFDLFSDEYMRFVTTVAAHEFGHSLKLTHPGSGDRGATITRLSPGQTSIMQAHQDRTRFVIGIQDYDRTELSKVCTP